MAMTKGQKTSQRILETAEAQFARLGYEATSLREIAAAVNIQQPGLYKHFASKDELYRRVYDEALGPLTALMDEALAGKGRLERMASLPKDLTELLGRHPNVARLLLRALISDEADEVAFGWLERLIGYGRQLSEALGAAEDANLLALQVISVFNMLFGYFWAAPLLKRLTGADPADPEMLARQMSLLDQFVTAMGEGAGRPWPPLAG